MPKYFGDMVSGCILYFTSYCVLEAMHTHASKDGKKRGAAKLWVGSDGSTKVEKSGDLTQKQIKEIRQFIKDNYVEMFEEWSKYSKEGYYRNIGH